MTKKKKRDRTVTINGVEFRFGNWRAGVIHARLGLHALLAIEVNGVVVDDPRAIVKIHPAHFRSLRVVPAPGIPDGRSALPETIGKAE